MEEGKRSGRCYVAAFVVFAVAFALYVFEAAIMLINSAEVNVFSALLILSVVIGAIALALAVLSLTVFKSKRKIKVLFLILAAALILIASFFAVYGYGEKGGPEWLIKHDVGGFTFDAIVGAAALIVAIVALIVVSITATAEVRAEKRVINKQKRAEKKAENELVKARNAEKHRSDKIYRNYAAYFLFRTVEIRLYERNAGVVYKRIDEPEIFFRRRKSFFDARRVRQIELYGDSVHAAALKLERESLGSLLRSVIPYRDRKPAPRELAHDRFAYTLRPSGHKSNTSHL